MRRLTESEEKALQRVGRWLSIPVFILAIVGLITVVKSIIHLFK